MLQIIQNNLNICPKTKANIIWDKITNGITVSGEEFDYIANIKDIQKLEYIGNGRCILNSCFKTKRWYKYGKLHREDGPAVEWSDGTKKYYKYGELHRENGPAIEYACGSKKYFINGLLHREDGPAIDWINGYKGYYIDGERYSKIRYNKYYEMEL